MAQIPQTSYLSLLTPYSFFGLGRTNNYVENLFVGSTRHQPKHFTNIEGLIPNSQVFILPYQAEGETDPGSWSRELFLHPGDWVPGVTLTVLGAIVVLAITVLVLHLRERSGASIALIRQADRLFKTTRRDGQKAESSFAELRCFVIAGSHWRSCS